jgi:hypothetical protein
MSINISQRAGFPAELSAVMTGAAVKIGTLLYNPVQIIFDNQGAVSIAISIDGGTTTWRTFPAGEALVLDMRGNHGVAPNFTIDKGTTFYGTGASGTFSISYLYATGQ